MLPRVLLIGGAPMVGKSTVARILGRRHDYSVISTDDLGVAVQAALRVDEAEPAEDHRDYYLRRTVDQLWREELQRFRALEAPLRALTQLHANAWSTPAIIEGWAVLPSALAAGGACVWLVGTRDVLDARIRADLAFWSGARDEELMISKFVERSLRLHDLLFDAAKLRDMHLIHVSAEDSAEHVAGRIEALFASSP